MLIIIVSGSRFGYNPQEVTDYLDELYNAVRAGASCLPAPDQLVIKEGCARGVDEQVEQWGFDNDADHIWARSGKRSTAPLVIEHWPAEWTFHKDCWCKNKAGTCKYAGHRRNREMADSEETIDKVVAFHDDIMKSKGTLRMVQIADEKHIDYEVIGSVYVPK